MKNMTKSKHYVIPCACLPLELRHEEKNLVLRTATGCEIASAMARASVVALLVEDDGLPLLKERVERAIEVEPPLFKADRLRENASYEEVSRHSSEYSKKHREWGERNLTIRAVQEKLKDVGLRFTEQHFHAGYL